MDLGIRGKRALVGGGSRGIGFSSAERLVDAGCDVAVIARNRATVTAAAERLSSGGRRAIPIAADLSTKEGVESAWAAAVREMGGVDILVNNGGGPPAGQFDGIGDDDWLRAFELVLMSTVRMTRLALPGMKSGGWGRVVNVMSTSVRQPVENLILSNSIRMSVVGMMKTLTLEYAGCGITFNTVAPGYTTTERLEALVRSSSAASGRTEAEVRQAWASDVPLRRLGKPEEVAAAVAFFASQPAAYVNGTILPVDGGRVRSI